MGREARHGQSERARKRLLAIAARSSTTAVTVMLENGSVRFAISASPPRCLAAECRSTVDCRLLEFVDKKKKLTNFPPEAALPRKSAPAPTYIADVYIDVRACLAVP